MIKRISLAILSLLLFASTGLSAEKPPAVPTAKEAQASAAQEPDADDPLGRSTPHGTVLGFMKAMERADYERAVEYLDTKQPPRQAEQLARELQFILDKGLSGNLDDMSRKPEGELADGLKSNREKVGAIKTPAASLDILLEKVQRGTDPPVWLFSSDTLRRVPHIYDQLEMPVLDRHLPTILTQKRILQVPLWRWIAFFVVLPLLFILAHLVSRLLMPLLRPLIYRLAQDQDEQLIERIKNPFRLVILALSVYAYAPLSHSALSRLFWNRMAETLTVIGLTWLCLRLIDILVDRVRRVYQMTPSSGRIGITKLGGQICKGIAIIIAAATILYYAGINLTAVLTGLGVGGIAIAFAAQKTLENLFGGIMIASDQPIRVGDYCKAGEHSGTVESIGLRSTRIRTIDRTIVSVPNGQLSVMSLENFAVRDKIKFNHTISLRSETTSDQLRHILSEIRKMLDEHPKVEAGSWRVRLVSLKNSNFDVEVFCYVLATSWDVFLDVQEEMLLRIIETVESSGSMLASSLQTVFVSTVPDAPKGRTGEKAAGRKRQDQGQLVFPGSGN
jgi:MscS family membrane protein